LSNTYKVSMLGLCNYAELDFVVATPPVRQSVRPSVCLSEIL